MADVSQRVQRKLAAHLREGEVVEVAVLVEPRGTYGLRGLSRVALPGNARRLAERADREHDEAGGMAAGFPGESSIIAVTQTRILVAPSNGIRVRPPVLEAPRGSMLVRSIRRSGLGRRIDLVFADGSGVALDAGNLQPFDRLGEALGRAL